MDRAIFYKTVRENPFPGKLASPQVAGMEAILNEWDKRALEDTRWLAYILATAYHETAFTMQPIEEYGKGRKYTYGAPDPETGQTYYGRGFVQLTWKRNYQQLGGLLKVDLAHKPELALDLVVATQITFEGMIGGLFTGKKLAHYFREDSDWYNARKIINGLDKAEQIGRYGRMFWCAILMANGEVEKAQAVPKGLQDPGDDPLLEIRAVAHEFGGASNAPL